MNFRLTHVLASMAILLLGASIALADSNETIWTIDPTQSKVTLNINPITAPPGAVFPNSPGYIGGDIDLGTALGFQAQLGIRNQVTHATWGTNPDGGPAAPGNTAKLSGTLGTTYIDSGPSASIWFQQFNNGNPGALITAVPVGLGAPKPADWNPTLYGPTTGGFSALHFAPAAFATEGYIPQLPGPVAFVSQQNVLLDLHSGTLAVNGLGQFAANSSTVGIKQSDFALISLTNQTLGVTDFYDLATDTSPALVGTNGVPVAVITNLGGNLRQLTYTFAFPAFLPFGSLGGVPLAFPLIETGTIVATALVPEPSTIMLAGMGLVGLALCARRRLRRS